MVCCQYGFSVVVPVLNEAEHINTVIEHIHSLKSEWPCEIIVVDGDPAGGTIEQINCPDVVTVVSEKGRAIQMNAGAAIAKGDILIFLHADTKLPAGAMAKVESVLQRDGYAAGAFDLGIESDDFFIKLIAAGARIRSRMSRVPYGDQAIFMRREYFEEIGGYKEIALMEDVELMRRIKDRGDEIFILKDRVKTSGRRWEKHGAFYTTLKNQVLLVLYRLGVSPERLAKFYYGNGLSPWAKTEDKGSD